MCRHRGEALMQLLLLICVTAAVEAVPAPDTIFKDNVLYEGDKCGLPSMQTGICRKATLCPQGIRANGARCEFSGNDAVVCCPTELSSNDGTGNRITPRIASQECERFKSNANSLTDHLSGRRFEASQGEFPFVGLIIFNDITVRCAASLISKRFLLTAAHCFRNNNATKVALGIVQVNDRDGDEYRIRAVHIHENYEPKKRTNDIALVELEQDVDIQRDVTPICLNTDLSESGPSNNLTVMGWGDDGGGQHTDKLWKATVNEIRVDECKPFYKKLFPTVTINENHLCALGEKWNDEYTDACQGDSGGPLVIKKQKFYLVGVVSTGAVCGSVVPGLYTRVSQYLDWIEQRVWGNSN